MSTFVGRWEGKFENYTIMGISEVKKRDPSVTEKVNQIKILVNEFRESVHDVEVELDFCVDASQWSCSVSQEGEITGELSNEGELRAEGFIKFDMRKGTSKLPVLLTGRVDRIGKEVSNRLTGVMKFDFEKAKALIGASGELEKLKNFFSLFSFPFSLVKSA